MLVDLNYIVLDDHLSNVILHKRDQTDRFLQSANHPVSAVIAIGSRIIASSQVVLWIDSWLAGSVSSIDGETINHQEIRPWIFDCC